MLTERYHLPHNSVRIDEFKHMLACIDLTKEYYKYDELRLHFLRSQINDQTLKIFHPAYHKNLLNHKSASIRSLYEKACQNPSTENLKRLLDCQYTDKKTFKQVFNETVRDYTEFFAFLGLLTTYYKGRTGGEKKHYVTQRLKDYRSGAISIQDLLLEFRYRNTSKDYESLSMYSITVRPFCVALKALKYYFDNGYSSVSCGVLSAIVTYAHNENIDSLLQIFKNPTLPIEKYKDAFAIPDGQTFENIKRELGRATTMIKPYLEYLGFVALNKKGSHYFRGKKKITNNLFTDRAAFCNCDIGNVALTPVIGKLLYKMYSLAKRNIASTNISDLFDENIIDEKDFLLSEFKKLGLVLDYDNNVVKLSSFVNQYSINPYTEFFEIEDCNYVDGRFNMSFSSDEMIIKRRNEFIENELDVLKPIALGSNGQLYEESLYKIIKSNFPVFNTVWYGANSTGKRLSDIVIRAKIRDEHGMKNILIIVECKAGNAIKAFDERKEKDDIQNTLQKEKELGTSIDGVWYWVVDSDALPSVDEHGGYRSNAESRSFVEKLNAIQFDVSEYMRVPTIVTAFSFEAIRSYIQYLSDKIGMLDNTAISKVDIPHFWRWSKKFMNLQYVMVHKELRLNA